MDEDKIGSDVSDKRKLEEDSVNPKPNPKRIKLVRPVFSPVAKPTISSTTESIKSDVQPTEIPKCSSSTEIPKCSSSTEKVLNVVDISQRPEKSTDLPETIKKSIDQLETVVKPVTTLPVFDEQVDSSSDALDISNIFSEETKKELEHLKKHILKIDDDGSSSENDSQPKRPRLKRPTFFTSATESKVEPNDTNIVEKANETLTTDLEKSVCEENINNIDKIINKQSMAESKVDKITENLTENSKNDKEEQDSIVTENIVENISIDSEKIEEALNEKSIVIENINRVTEKKSDVSNSINEMVKNEIDQTKCVDTILEENTIVVETLCEIAKTVVESINDDTLVKQNALKTNTCVQREINEKEKEKENILIEKKLIINDEVTQIAEEEDLKEQKLVEENTTIVREQNSEPAIIKNDVFESTKVVLDEFDENKVINPISATELKNENDVKVAAETNDEKLTEESTVKYNKIVEDQIEDTPTDKIVKIIKDDVAEQISNKNTQVENENKCSPKQTLNNEQNQEEHESQLFKSDILKAALMSRKSSELLVNSPEIHEEFGTNIHSLPVEIKKTDILPKIGQEAIVNKIETEIKLVTNDKLTSNKSQNMTHINVTEINISKEASNSICPSEHIMVNKHDEPPKWGSAKMNEVEKFLNDSNVTITPICKPQETPKLGKITLKLPKIGNPEIKSETTVRPDVKSELIKKITNKQIAMGESPLKNALSQPTKSFNDFAIIRPAPKLSAEQIAQIEQQILNTPKKRGRPSKALAQQKQLLLQYQQQQQQQLQQHKIQEGGTEDESVFHVPLFDMDDMSGGVVNMFDSFEASTPKLDKSIRGKGSRGRRGRGGGGGRVRGRDGSDSDTASTSRRVDEEIETFPEEMNHDEETKQVALIEAERLRKEEERERKMEARKQKLKERNDALKEKKMKKKQKAEERRLQWHEKKRLMQEEKARAAEMKKSLPPPQNFDDETRMSADCNNSRSQTPARNFMLGDDDLSISGSMNDSLRMKKGRMEVIDHESNKTLTVDQIAEYQWPLEGGELYMIQEQISNFLGVKSFKRKYPGLKRRNVEAEERTFLCDSGLVAESLCDLGLTVLYSSEVLDVMYADFPEKYEELREYMRLKHAKELSNRQKALITISSNADGSKLDVRDRAMESAANWNVNFNKSRLESRKCSMDMQSFIVHYPKNKCKKMAIPKLKIGSYPLALLPGQFCDYYATYSSEDLRYLPMNTVMYGPLKSIDKDFPVSLSSQSESEDSSSDDSSDSDDSIEVDNKSVKNGLENSPSDKKGAECKLCLGTAEKNKNGTVEPLIHCSKCSTIYHPTCLDMTLEMIPHIKRYNWQCNECKSCVQCKEIADEDKMLFCDLCDRGYHIYCVGLRKVPEGRWHCQECAMCSSCGVSDPGPGDSKWFYEFKKIEKTGSKVYRRTLCAPCSRLWKKGHYCPNCMRCYPIKNVERMTQCNSCDRYLHPECVSENTSNSQVVTCNICEEKAVSRLLTTVPRSLIKV